MLEHPDLVSDDAVGDAPVHHDSGVSRGRQRTHGGGPLHEIELVAAGVALETERQLEAAAAHLKRAVDSHVDVDIPPWRVVVIVVRERPLDLELDAVEQLAVHTESAAAPGKAILDGDVVPPEED